MVGITTVSGPGSRYSPGGVTEDWQLPDANQSPSRMALTIMHPQSGVTGPYTRAYPGILWERPVVVLGGSWPYKVELVQAPSGMTVGETLDIDEFNTTGLIGQAYSILSWDNPVTSGSPHTVEVLVTDQEGTTASETWTVTVTTTGFVFVDAATGNNANAGTLASPKENLIGVYGAAKATVSFAGQHCYLRAGTYEHDILPIEDGVRVTWTGNKPFQFEAYPGETVTIDCANAYWNMETPNDLAWIGLRFTGLNAGGGYKYLQWAGGDRNLVYKNYFGTGTGGIGGSNSAFMFIANVPTTTDSAIIRNTLDTPLSLALVETYACDGVVIEGNLVTNYTGSNCNGYYPKIDNTNMTVRANRSLSGCEGYFFVVDTYADNGPMEVCWNLMKVTSGDEYVQIGRENVNDVDVFFDRNTCISGSINMDDATGTFTLFNNVRQHDGTDADGITHTGGTEATISGILTDLSATSGLCDTTTGHLVGTNEDDYLGIKGFQVSTVEIV